MKKILMKTFSFVAFLAIAIVGAMFCNSKEVGSVYAETSKTNMIASSAETSKIANANEKLKLLSTIMSSAETSNVSKGVKTSSVTSGTETAEVTVSIVDNGEHIEIKGHYKEREYCARMTYLLTEPYAECKIELTRGYAKYNYGDELWQVVNNVENDAYSLWQTDEFRNFYPTVNESDLYFGEGFQFEDKYGNKWSFSVDRSDREPDANCTYDEFGNWTWGEKDPLFGSVIWYMPAGTGTIVDVDVELTSGGWRIINRGRACRIYQNFDFENLSILNNLYFSYPKVEEDSLTFTDKNGNNWTFSASISCPGHMSDMFDKYGNSTTYRYFGDVWGMSAGTDTENVDIDVELTSSGWRIINRGSICGVRLVSAPSGLEGYDYLYYDYVENDHLKFRYLENLSSIPLVVSFYARADYRAPNDSAIFDKFGNWTFDDLYSGNVTWYMPAGSGTGIDIDVEFTGLGFKIINRGRACSVVLDCSVMLILEYPFLYGSVSEEQLNNQTEQLTFEDKYGNEWAFTASINYAEPDDNAVYDKYGNWTTSGGVTWNTQEVCYMFMPNIEVVFTKTGWRIISCFDSCTVKLEVAPAGFENYGYLYFDYPAEKTYTLKETLQMREGLTSSTAKLGYKVTLKDHTIIGKEFIKENNMIGFKSGDGNSIIAYFDGNSGKSAGWYYGVKKTGASAVSTVLTLRTGEKAMLASVVDEYNFEKVNGSATVSISDNENSELLQFLQANVANLPHTGILINNANYTANLVLIGVMLVISLGLLVYVIKKKSNNNIRCAK